VRIVPVEGTTPLQINAHLRTWHAGDVDGLWRVLSWRDSRGGAVFCLRREGAEYPCLAIRTSGNLADIHYFAEEGHPGFRCVGGEGLPEDGETTLVFEGCDPASGEPTPNGFVVPFETAASIATEFFRTGGMLDTISWFEL
jgi:hypothetical protein